jgi:hypothetical protein
MLLSSKEKFYFLFSPLHTGNDAPVMQSPDRATAKFQNLKQHFIRMLAQHRPHEGRERIHIGKINRARRG